MFGPLRGHCVENGASALAPVVAQFWGCNPDQSAQVAARGRVSVHAARSPIQTSDRPRGLVFVMIDGQARALAYSLDGRQVLVEEFHRGDLFGEVAAFALAGDARADEIVAHGPVMAGQFATPVFLGLMEQHSCIAMAVAQTLTRRLALANRRVVQIATISAPGRVYAELLRMARESRGWRIAPAPVLAELALTVQTTRETTSRAVSQLERRGIIAREDGALVIVAPHRLEELIF